MFSNKIYSPSILVLSVQSAIHKLKGEAVNLVNLKGKKRIEKRSQSSMHRDKESANLAF